MLKQFLSTVANQNTRDAYGRDVQRFIDWVGQDALAALEPQELLDYVAHLQDEGYEGASINRKLAAVKSFLAWAVLTGKVRAEVLTVAQLVKGVKAAQKLPRPLSASEQATLLAQPNLSTLAGARDFAFIRLALATGARLTELVQLTIEALDFEKGEVIVFGKGSKERPVFFDGEDAAALVFYLGLRGNPRRGNLFVNEAGERISPRYFQKALKAYGEAAGIEDLHPHRLRHTMATAMLDATGDIAAVGTLLGHADLRTTQRYTSLATRRLRANYDSYREQQVPVELERQEALIAVGVPR
jgi:integrase/recombinase XerD